MTTRPVQRAAVIAGGLALVVSSFAIGGPVAATEALPATDPADVDDVERKLSHFLCYGGKLGGFRDEADAPEVDLESITRRTTTVGVSRAFCNPVKKKKGRRLLAPIVSKRHHLKSYSLQWPIVDSNLGFGVSNQFVTDDLIRFNLRPFALLVPTRKFPHAFPRGLDHYLCYPVLSGSSVDRRFKLIDQFRRYKRMLVSQPVAFCAPAKKVHGSKAFGVRHPEAHLVCYLVSTRRLDPKRRRLTSNQFEKRKRITAKRTGSLCVPTLITRA